MPTIEVMEILATTMRRLVAIASDRGNPFDSSYGEIASQLQFPHAITITSLIRIREGGLIRVNPITSPRAVHVGRRFRLDFKEEDISRLSETLASRWYNFAGSRGSEWQIVNTPFAARRERERRREERELEDRATASEAIALKRATGQCQVCRGGGSGLRAYVRPWVWCESGGLGPTRPEHFIVLCDGCGNVLEECEKRPCENDDDE